MSWINHYKTIFNVTLTLAHKLTLCWGASWLWFTDITFCKWAENLIACTKWKAKVTLKLNRMTNCPADCMESCCPSYCVVFHINTSILSATNYPLTNCAINLNKVKFIWSIIKVCGNTCVISLYIFKNTQKSPCNVINIHNYSNFLVCASFVLYI